MNRLLQYLIVGLLIIIVSGFFVPQQINDYKMNWDKVEKYVEDGLPKSALKIVDDIYKQAKKEANEPQIIKCLIFRISLQSQFEEEHLEKAISTFEKELEMAKSPQQQILHSLLAELYQWYYQQNRWQINDRGVVLDFDQKDLNTWDAVMINKKIKTHYLESVLNHEQLKSINLEDFKAVLSIKDTSGFLVWPSLYDLLGNRALDYFSSTDASLSEIGNYNTVHDNKLLLPAEDFIQLSLDGIDEQSSTYTVLKLYQHLLQTHMQTKNVDAFVDLDLKRLQYIFNLTDKSEENLHTYEQTLQSLRKQYKTNPVYVRVSAKLAQLYVELGKKYVAAQGDKYRYHLNIAEQICNEAIFAYPDAEYSKACNNIINEINKTKFEFQVENAVYPGKPFLGYLSFKNIEKLHFKIVKVSSTDYLKNKSSRDRIELVKTYIDNPTAQKWLQKLPESDDYQKHTTEIIIPALESGFYMIYASTSSTFDDEDIIYRQLWASPLSYMSKNNPSDGSIELYVVDRESGSPEEGVNITAYEKRYISRKRSNEYLHAGDFVTDKSGYAKLDFQGKVKNASISFMLEKNCEPIFSESDNYIYVKPTNVKSQTKTYLFTDRAIYRPGQTVYFKGIVVDKKANEVKLIPDYSARIEFRNVNRKEVSNLELKTNESGSYQGAFVIPKGGLNGQMSLKTKTGSVTFLVEEYKRPTFFVSFDTLQGEYKLNDTVAVTGKAENYTGSSAMNASVKYRVVRSMIYVPYSNYYNFYRPMPYEQPEEIANGQVFTNENGKFELQFQAKSGSTRNSFKSSSYQYTVYADVTDITGEVQSTNTNISIGKESLLLSIDGKDKIHKETTDGITLSAKNLAGSPVNTKVKLELYKLSAPTVSYVKRYWSKPGSYHIGEEEFKTHFSNVPYKEENDKNKWPKQAISSQKILLNGSAKVLKEHIRNADIGEYLIKATTITKSGDTITQKQFFSLFSTETKKLPGSPTAWFYMSKQNAEPGDVIQLAVGSATKKAKVYYEILNGDEFIESNWITVSNGQKIIDIPVKESYRGNFTVNVNLIRFNRQYVQSFIVEVPFSNKKLNITLETHRDHLSPGQKEEWKVKIKGPEGENLAAELLAGMYDASLDQFRSNTWKLNLYQNKNNNSRWSSGYFNASWARDLYPKRPQPLSVQVTLYPEVNWFGYQHYSIRPPLYRTNALEMKAAPAEGGLAEVELTEDKDELISKDQTATGGGNADTPKQEMTDAKELSSPRTNFNETAFFFPQLKTDSSGNVVFSFTTPDALTEWKLMMLAHSQDLKVGSFVKNIKANKELMVMPNLPRFVRQGDRLMFTSKVVNYTDQEITPELSVEFFDPVSGKEADIFSTKEALQKTLTIKAKQSGIVKWEILIPYDLDLLAYRIKATTDSFTDSEERMIPVLPNKMLVTETMPMPVSGNETKLFVFSDLVISDKIMAVSTRKNYRFTVEFTSNPAWYAVQALPYLSEPEIENSSNLFSRYYTNSLASYIINSNPKMKNVFESWKEVTPDAFYSSLQKNEELKNVVLDATPWVLEAENETEQKRRIGILFDINRIANEKDNALSKLRTKQLPNGAWPWFKGMREDRHTTQNIVLGVGKLLSKKVISLETDRELKQMIKRAVGFLDKRIIEDYEKLKKNNPKGMKNNHLSSAQIEYLYARALLSEDFPIPSKTQLAFDYYFGQAKKFWLKKSNYLQGMIALTMYRFGHRNEAEGIMRSLKERALHNEELGMYWRQELSWRWYEAPVETQAILIDAFNQIMNDPKSVEQMKIWLLKQKQTTSWKTTSATTEAVYALLLTGQDLLSEDKLVEVKVGSKTIIPKQIEGMKVEAGTGYFKNSWKGKEIKAEMGTIEISNPNKSIAWGAAYWQYFENLDRIKGNNTPLSIEKQMFIEVFTDEGPVMKIMEEGHLLKTGDKVIVRLIISSDRNMEYIHLKDMRASALEPMDQLSGHAYKGGLGFYKNVKDVSIEFFIQHLNKGTYVLEYPLMVTQKGDFSNGIATLQSYYAPEFAAHSEGRRLVVK